MKKKTAKERQYDLAITKWEDDEYGVLDLRELDKYMKLHKNCTVTKCVAGAKHIESCQNEEFDTNLDTSNTKPF